MLIELLAVCGMLCLGLAGSISERRKWNDGICKENGETWVLFDRDSQGGRGYKAGDYTCWISWPMIDS